MDSGESSKTIHLSSFIAKKFLYLTIKYSKGINKHIHVGAHEYIVKSLVFKVNSTLEHYYFHLSVANNVATFQQSEDGNLEIKINSDISIDCTDEIVSDSYIEFSGKYIKIKERKFGGF